MTSMFSEAKCQINMFTGTPVYCFFLYVSQSVTNHGNTFQNQWGEKNLSGIDWIWFLICLMTFSIIYN